LVKELNLIYFIESPTVSVAELCMLRLAIKIVLLSVTWCHF